MKETPKILEKCCEETHQNHKSESDGKETADIKEELSKVLSIDKRYIFILDAKDTEQEAIKKIITKDELFSGNEKWYLVCGKEDSKIDILLLCDKIKDIPCNVIFNNCNICLHINKPENTEKDYKGIIKNYLYFCNCTFDKLFKKSLNLKNIIFKKTLTFNQCVFYSDLEIYQNQFLDHLVFINCYDKRNDKKITSLDLQENEFEGYLFIKNCAIEKINLWKNKFKNRCYFVDSNFGYKDKDNTTKLNFSNTHFKDNVYFNNSEFYSYADFHECEFDDIACFYGVKFHKIPNFSACYFKEQKAVNLINVDIDKLDFKSVEKYIEDNYQDETCENKQEITEEQRNNNCKLKCAKHLKDSFRVIKDVLITQNNTLEAQEWHKLELYAKEKENHINLSIKDREKNADIFKNILIWFNCVLLNVYRNTSDHHNDFLKILNFTVGMIVLYGVFIFFCQACIEPYSKFFNELKSSVIFIIIGILVFLCCIMFYFNRKKSIFAKSIFFIIAMVFIVLYLVTYFYKTNEYKTILYLVMCYILSIYICYFFFNIKNIIFNIVFKFMLYLVFLFFLINSSQLINPFTGVFSSGKLYESQFEKSLNDLNASAIVNLASILQNDFNLHLKDQNISFTELNSAKALIIANKENLLKLNDVNSNITKEVLGEKYTELLKIINQDKITENTIKSTSVLYSIILLLCIFSLQKTARKNSIVPS
ncbi:pentapeptide repeat-containing protein [Campylobacter jejuni]|uniref:pentapeptide repeat-containing protein n=1 Tax=Campylobacter jejuni TaxID=197 RepID=UPI001CCF87BB|nr:pentapeptide repeat-containing protein [Campylobacter jejuni]